MQNFGLNCNYFSKAEDCGLIQQKTEGSLAKSTGRTGTLRSGPSDPDLMARIKGGAVLISAVHPISGGQGGSGAWGGGALLPATLFAAARR